jgi:hypothetical protein
VSKVSLAWPSRACTTLTDSPLPNWQARVVVPELVEAGAVRSARGLDIRTPYIPERGTPDWLPGMGREHQTVLRRQILRKMRRERIDNDGRQRNAARGCRRLRWCQVGRTAGNTDQLPMDAHNSAQKVDPGPPSNRSIRLGAFPTLQPGSPKRDTGPAQHRPVPIRSRWRAARPETLSPTAALCPRTDCAQ